MAMKFCDVYVDENLIAHCELKAEEIQVGKEIYITGEASNFVINSIEETKEPLKLNCEPVFTSDVYAAIWHHSSFTHKFEREQDGISPKEQQKIIRLLYDKGYLALQVYYEHGVITYGVLDTDRVMVDYFYAPCYAIEWLEQE